MVENLPANAGDSIPELGRAPGGEHADPLQQTCLQSSMHRGAWLALVHGVRVRHDLATGQLQLVFPPILFSLSF